MLGSEEPSLRGHGQHECVVVGRLVRCGARKVRPLAVFARRNGIIAARMKWMTLGETLDGEDSAVEQAVREQAVFGIA